MVCNPAGKASSPYGLEWVEKPHERGVWPRRLLKSFKNRFIQFIQKSSFYWLMAMFDVDNSDSVDVDICAVDISLNTQYSSILRLSLQLFIADGDDEWC